MSDREPFQNCDRVPQADDAEAHDELTRRGKKKKG